MILISTIHRQILIEEVRLQVLHSQIRQTVVIPVRSEAVQLVADVAHLAEAAVDVVEDVKF